MTRKGSETSMEELQRRWEKKTGEPMPDSIAALPIEKVRRAVLLTERGVTVVVPVQRQPQPVAESFGGGSMMDWDRQSEF